MMNLNNNQQKIANKRSNLAQFVCLDEDEEMNGNDEENYNAMNF